MLSFVFLVSHQLKTEPRVSLDCGAWGISLLLSVTDPKNQLPASCTPRSLQSLWLPGIFLISSKLQLLESHENEHLSQKFGSLLSPLSAGLECGDDLHEGQVPEELLGSSWGWGHVSPAGDKSLSWGQAAQ